MEKRLLFINRSVEEIRDFKNAVPQGKYIIDTAQNGYDAGILLKKHEYSVIVLDMYLEGFDGEQIIKYLNETHPDTICIVYTYSLTRGQLIYLLKNRNVFRIFLSPANFLEEMIPAIDEAFAVAEQNVLQKEQEKTMEELVFSREKSIEEKNFVLEHRDRANRQFLTFSKKVLLQTFQMSGDLVSEEKKKELFEAQKELLESATKVLENPCISVEDMKRGLQQEFAGELYEMEFATEYNESDVSKIQLNRIYASLWILLEEYRRISEGNRIGIGISSFSGGGIQAVLHILLPKRVWNPQGMEQVKEKRKLVELAVEEMVDSCECYTEENEIIYKMILISES